MPIKRKSFKRKPKRTFRRKAGRHPATTVLNTHTKALTRTISWRGCPFPKILKTQFTYAENITMTATAGLSQNYVYVANGLFDPNYTGTGLQPRYYDTLLGANNTNAPYRDYCVYKSKATAQIMSSTSDTNTARALCGLGCFVSGTSGPSSLHELQERKDFSKKFLGMSVAGHDMIKLKRVANIAAELGIKDLADESGAKATYTANPSNQVFFGLSCMPVDEASTVTYRVIVKITFYAYLYARSDVADS